MTLAAVSRTECIIEPRWPVFAFQSGSAQQVTPVVACQIDRLVKAAHIPAREQHQGSLDPLAPERSGLVVDGPPCQRGEDPDDMLGSLRVAEVAADPPTEPRRDLRHHSMMSRSGTDRGAITLFAVLMFTVMLLAAGLVVDGGAKLTAARQATALAEEAARAGAEQANLKRAYVQGGSLVVSAAAAAEAARAWLAATGHPGTVVVSGPASITVTVTVTAPTVILSLIGIGSVTAHGTATATLVQGIGSGRSP